MRTKLRSKISLLFVACAVLVAIPAIAAFADNLQDEVTSGGGTQTIATGAANGFTNTYRIVGNGVDGCNVDSANPATFNVNAPSQVTTSTPTLTFTDCGAAGEKTVTFSSNTVNATGYTINPTYASGGKPGNNGWNLTSAELTLKVVAAPTVTAVTPTDEATGVAVGSNVTATFSAAMDATTGDGDPSTITTSTFKLVKDGDATNTALNAAVTYDSSTNKATLNPSADLLPGTKYNATVVSGANGVRTSSGNYTIEQDETWSFTTFNPNTAPTANGQMVSTNEDTAKTITLTGSDPDGNNLSFSTTTQPAHGSLGTIGTPVCDASAKTCSADVTYAPTADYFGADSFKFRVNDGTVNSTEATVTIDVTAVDDPPTAVNDSATVQEDSGATAINVLANDTDADGGSKTITSKTNGSHGTVAITGSGTGLTYQPNADYCNDPPGTSPDTFTYTLNGGSTATVSVKVTCVNDAPTQPGTISSNESLNNDGTFTLSWGASTDVDSANITYTLEQRDNDDTGWSEVASGLTSASYTFGGTNAAELEGLWDYRVKAVDDYTTPASSAYRENLDLVKVDKTNPNAPTLSFATTGQSLKATVNGVDWYKDSVKIDVADNGDPALSDTSAGSGVDATSFPASFSVTTNGTSTASKTVKDNATNESAAGTLTVNVDKANPTVSITSGCPSAPVVLNSTQSINVTASDGESGLVSDPSGSVALDTSSVGSKTKTITVEDNVGHTGSATCTYSVKYGFSGFLQPINDTAHMVSLGPDVSTFKAGSTVPVKFYLTDADGNRVQAGSAQWITPQKGGATTQAVDESVFTDPATTGTLYKYDATAQQYIYNWSTKGVAGGFYYKIGVKLDDGQTYYTYISLR